MKTLATVALRLHLTITVLALAALTMTGDRPRTRTGSRFGDAPRLRGNAPSASRHATAPPHQSAQMPHSQSAGSPNSPASDRGDVPGWVMITMMTAIVVIVLLGVFKDAVVDAVTHAFQSVQDAG